MDAFDVCSDINDYLKNGQEKEARDQLIKLLGEYESDNKAYPEIVNHFIRETGLYPYMQTNTAEWSDRFAYEAFKVDVGGDETAVLHRSQSKVLKQLLDGESLAISAPTSFGKSFIIDSFISLNQPSSVMIIVPTIALMDEVRRRLYKKFSKTYKIVTTPNTELAQNNIMIFPQERALQYSGKIESLDLLIVDEFYKASKKFDKERAPALIRLLMKLEKKAKQKYFLAPNISTLKQNPFTAGMNFISLDFNTVFLETHNLYNKIGKDESLKSEELINILKNYQGKTLIYAGTYSNIDKVANLLLSSQTPNERSLLNDFSTWLAENYDPNWNLTRLVLRGAGIHNGSLHRALSQIQVKLFEEDSGLDILVSTSSIIEGVNTSAENVVIWRNKTGSSNLNNFNFKNIIGRGGRMFKYFVGNAFILEAPPKEEETQLELEITDELTGDLEEGGEYYSVLTDDKKKEIREFHAEMDDLLGKDVIKDLQNSGMLQNSDSKLFQEIARKIYENPGDWRSLGHLNSPDVEKWDGALYKLIYFKPGGWETAYSKFVDFVKVISKNWENSIPDLLHELDDLDLGIQEFFKLERNASYKMGSLANDFNVIQDVILGGQAVDISPFVYRVSYAFLPPSVYQLEEFGLPRMISKKIQRSGVFDFGEIDDIETCLGWFNDVGIDYIKGVVPDLDDFDIYILKYFYEGIGAQ